MKTLGDHVIFYDGNCPLCSVYTSAFVSSGMLDSNGRQPYQQGGAPFTDHVDCGRAVDEIAILNRKTGEVTYGVNSLFLVIGHSFPVFRPLFQCRPFAWLSRKAYRFISFNRRVIVPSRSIPGDAEPSLHRGYRTAYIAIATLITAWVLSRYTLLLGNLLPGGAPLREYLVCGGQVLWQAAALAVLRQQQRWAYLGNLVTIWLGGALLLLPFLFFFSLLPVLPAVALTPFLIVVFLMFLEHIRRVRLLGLTGALTAGWIAYRVAALALICA